MNAHSQITPLAKVRASLADLTMSQQLEVLEAILGEGLCEQSDDFNDALYPVYKAFTACYESAQRIADPDPMDLAWEAYDRAEARNEARWEAEQDR